jgi:DNA-binding MarR family transcriptional regulator
MAEETQRGPRKARAQSRTRRAEGAPRERRAAAAGAEGGEPRARRAGAGAGEKAAVTPRDLIYMVARAAGGFESILKTKEPALSLSQWAILEMLAKEGGTARPSQIAKKLAFSRQHIRLAAKKLMKAGLMSAEAPEEGKKAVGLTLTDAGRTQLSEIEKATDALAEALKDDKRGGGLNQAARTLKVMTSAIVAQVPKDERKGKKKAEADAEDEADVAAG